MTKKQIIKRIFDKEFNVDDMRVQILLKNEEQEKKHMTKYLKYALSIFAIFIISGVLSLNVVIKEKHLDGTKEKQENVEMVEKFLEGKNIITSSSSSSVADKIISEDFPTIVKYCDAVVKGKVLSIDYEVVGRSAWTKIIFRVNDVFKGDISINEDIEIHLIGGYISLEDHIKVNDDAYRYENLTEEEIKNTILKEYHDGESEFIKENEELILCIAKARGYSPFPENSYERVFPAGMLKERDNKFVQLYGDVKDKYSVSKDNLNDIKKLVIN